MIAESQLTTNNQQLTTKRRGPKTPEGKKRSSLNALKHGLSAKAPHALAALEENSTIKLKPFVDWALEWAQPQGAAEERLARQIARGFWTYFRIKQMKRQIQAHILLSDSPSLSARAVKEYERTLRRRITRDMSFFNRKGRR
ncbi:MAG: hypothetical protein Q7T82_01875 [Armatimonadota bacterium]|nr:hypothetical protein [Armatimonadota bacterium]